MNSVQLGHTNQPEQIASLSQWIGNGQSAQIQVDRGFATTSERALDSHEHLYMCGDQHTHVYQVLEGVVGVYQMLADGRRQIVSFYYPGDLIGAVDQGSTSQHAEALCASRVRCIPVKTIETLISSQPGFGQAMLATVATELAETRDQLLSLGRKSAAEKLATFLLRISRRNARENQNDTQLYLPMTRAEIGDYLGLTIETVSRNMTRLRVAGIIRLEGKSRVQILNLEKLAELANGAS